MSITSYSAVHNADGGLVGEGRYVLHRNEVAPELAALRGGSVEAFALALGNTSPVIEHGKDL